MLSWKNAFIYGLVGAVFVLFITVFVIRSGSVGLGGLSGIEVDWRLLGELDFVTGRYSDELKAVNGQKVRVPGFMVPLEDNSSFVSEFLLVPTPQACIHVPAPPPNQMVHVFTADNKQEVAYGPIWVTGDLKIATIQSIYGASSFEIRNATIEPYR